jgi:hypothetical protein
VESELIQVHSETTAIQATDPTAALSDIESSLVIVKSDLVVIDDVVSDLNEGIIYGTAQTGTLTTTACTTDLTGYADDDLINRSIVFTGGTADGCGAAITDYASASGLVSFSGGIATAPANGDTFKIV